MKFLYINNELCAGCNKCYDTCPTKAIYTSGNKKYINYDKCISCGSCFRECLHRAISIEKIERITQEIDRLDEQRAKVEDLKKENAALREEISVLSAGLHTLIRKLPVATVITDNNGRIRMANPAFTELAGVKGHDENSELNEVELRDIVEDEIYNFFINANLGEDMEGTITRMNGHLVNLSIYSIRKRDIVIGMIRDLEIPSAANEETVRLIKTSIDRQMAMVQKIGFLLGEEVSEIARNLNSVIKISDKRHDE